MQLLRIIPAFPVHNIKEGAGFYEERMGFTCAYRDDGFARLTRDDVEIHLWAASDFDWNKRDLLKSPILSGAESFLAGTAGCRIEVTEIDPLFEELKSKKVLYNAHTVVKETPWNTREFPVLDLHRNLITFFQRIRN